jgi:hypothetical protein
MNRITLPTRALTDRRFVYVNAACTDIRRTWRKFRLLTRLQQKAAP